MHDPLSAHERDRQPERQSSWHRRRPGIRYLYSAGAVVGGALLAVRYAGDGTGGDWLFIGALIVIALGILSIPVYRWMDRRRL